MDAPLHVLVLEDRADDAELMVMELENAGYTVVWNRVDTQEGFRACLSDEIDLILADYSIPQFSAPQALALLQMTGRDTPFIVVSGTISEEAAVATLKQGAADYLLKDRLSRLGEAVRHALEQRDLRRARHNAERSLIVMGQAIETSVNAIVMTDLAGDITYVNRSVLDLWGIRDKDVIIGQSLAALWQPYEEGLELILRLKDDRAIKGEMQIVRPDGQEIILQYSGGTVIDTQGSPICLMSTFIDVTEQKHAERIRQEAELLRIELEKERELRELKSRFISMVVHDFRNPLSAIQLALTTFTTFPERIEPQVIAEKLSRAVRDVKRLNALIDDILLIGKMDFVAGEVNPQEVEAKEYLKDVFDDFCQGIETERHEFLFDAAADVDRACLLVDRSLFQRAIVNLLENAVKYSPSGGRVRVRLTTDLDSILIAVSDDGIGIPEEDRKLLFDGFHRAGNVGTIAGTGLGLSIVKHIVDVHGGTIRCDSVAEGGSTFTIKLPLATS